MTFTRPLSSSAPVALRPFTEIVPPNRVLLSFSVERYVARLDFSFKLMAKQTTKAEHLVLPPLQAAKRRKRRDELWKHTCFELFVSAPGGTEYVEVNLSPNGDWNMYGFTDYRAGMHPLENVSAPAMSFDGSPYDESLQWRCSIPSVLSAPVLVLGATAVLEYETGHREYWALAHAGGKPDFHLRESFCLVLDSSGVPPL